MVFPVALAGTPVVGVVSVPEPSAARRVTVGWLLTFVIAPAAVDFSCVVKVWTVPGEFGATALAYVMVNDEFCAHVTVGTVIVCPRVLTLPMVQVPAEAVTCPA